MGAGASRACGYPLTREIFPEVVRRLNAGNFDEHVDKNAKALSRFLAHWIPRRGVEAMPEITEILSILDYCLESGEELFAQNAHTLKLADARWLLERAIARVIRKIHKREVRPREIYEWIRGHKKRGKDVAIISTNYDFSLDRVLFEELNDWSVDYLKTDFGFTWRDPDDGALVQPANNPKIRLYKLHGSLNWLGCSRCGNIYVNFMRTLVTLADGDGEWSTCHCGYKPLRGVLITPSLVRRYRDRNLLNIWRSAYESLRLANDWLFIGYSLPIEDVGIRALLMRAQLSREIPPRVHVVGSGDDSYVRYRQLFPDCRYTADGLRGFLDEDCAWLGNKKLRIPG
jgi:NAD-dependent SIR2 family protein deacetylase